MFYVETTFTKQFDGCFCVQYIEVSDELRVSRSVERKWDGSLGWASAENPDGVNDVFLPEGPILAKSELFAGNGICKMDSDGEFASILMVAEEFEAIWKMALAENETS